MKKVKHSKKCPICTKMSAKTTLLGSTNDLIKAHNFYWTIFKK